MGKWQVPSTRAYNVLKMFPLVSKLPCPQCLWGGMALAGRSDSGQQSGLAQLVLHGGSQLDGSQQSYAPGNAGHLTFYGYATLHLSPAPEIGIQGKERIWNVLTFH